jgi:hypothetical protein
VNSRRSTQAARAEKTAWLAGLKRRDGELEVLRALANGKVNSARHRAVVAFLRDYDFLDSEHQVVYESVRAIAQRQPISASRLAAHLNNRGFPDIDLEKYFEGTPLDLVKALDLARALYTLKV